MKSDMLLAVMQLSAERNLPQESVVSAFEDAIAAAYRRDPAVDEQDVQVQLDPDSGEVIINTVVHVVEELDELDPRGQVNVEQARTLSVDARPGDDIITGVLDFTPQRIAARTVTQVLMQRLRSAERQLVFEQYADREGEIISAPIRRVASSRQLESFSDRPTVFVDLGKADAIMQGDEQSPNERYRTGMELKFFVVRKSRRLRDRLARSKIAVYSNKHDIDPIGACVGLRGIRIQNIVTELMGEKIDILEWSDDPAVFIANSLGPAQVEDVVVVDEDTVEVIVPENQLSLAIGKDGQNVSLATRLAGYRIDIKGSAAYAEELIDRQRSVKLMPRTWLLKSKQIGWPRKPNSRNGPPRMLNSNGDSAKSKMYHRSRRVRSRNRSRSRVETVAETEPVEITPVLYIPEPEESEQGETEPEMVVALEPEVTAEPEIEEEPVVEIAAELTDEIAVVEDEELTITEDPAIFEEEAPAAPAMPALFVPHVQRPEPPPSVAGQGEEDLDLELLELEEKLKELEFEEQERAEADRAAAELEALEQDIDSDDLWMLPSEVEVTPDTGESGLRFAEDISGYRDEDGRRGGGRRRGGSSRRNRR
ncbi:Transcription termination/antitermination protein NusA [Geodia barretti]|uniref:Transcription termination/antitermination protein NusA n=1 Tax=Geodia barretti TaxID=519541 RepID=A0AA35WFH4_GEOBA|nr:Transcription termination/antitermination protein NusA [Geodia barretti]